MGIIDKYKFEQGGDVGCSNSDYHLRQTTCCKAYCVEDGELSDLYLDPSDLLKKVSLLAPDCPDACPLCGSLQWNLTNEVLHLELVPEDWKWACRIR